MMRATVMYGAGDVHIEDVPDARLIEPRDSSRWIPLLVLIDVELAMVFVRDSGQATGSGCGRRAVIQDQRYAPSTKSRAASSTLSVSSSSMRSIGARPSSIRLRARTH